MITSCLSPDKGVVKEPSKLSQLFGVEDIPDKKQLSAIKNTIKVTIAIILIYVTHTSQIQTSCFYNVCIVITVSSSNIFSKVTKLKYHDTLHGPFLMMPIH